MFKKKTQTLQTKVLFFELIQMHSDTIELCGTFSHGLHKPYFTSKRLNMFCREKNVVVIFLFRPISVEIIKDNKSVTDMKTRRTHHPSKLKGSDPSWSVYRYTPLVKQGCNFES